MLHTVVDRFGSQGRRAGASCVEFAAVGSVFVLIIMGMFESGRMMMVQHLLTNAARQACRVGVLPGTSTQAITSKATQALADQGLNSAQASVQVNDGSADAATARSGDEITVIVSVPMSACSWVPAPKYLPSNVTGRYTLRRE